MRFASLIVELIRARPRLVLWLAVLAQAALWLIVAMLLYRGPPDGLAAALAYGHDYQLGSDVGPPLAYWLGDLAFRLAGNHLFGVYLLSQICFVVTFVALFELARRIVGAQHAAIAVLLTLTVTAFGYPSLAFGPAVLAWPLWSLILLHAWQVLGQKRRNAWFALSIEAGLLLLTTNAAPGLLVLLALFAVFTGHGRKTLFSFDPLFALLVIAILVLPYLVWLLRADAFAWLHPPVVKALRATAQAWVELLGWLVLAMSGIVLLIVLDSGVVHRVVLRSAEDVPTLHRAPVNSLGRRFVYFFALAPGLAGSLIVALYGFDPVFGEAGLALLPAGLAVVVASGDLIHLRRQRVLRAVWLAVIVAPALVLAGATLARPWIDGHEVVTSLPASEIAHFFSDSFRRRTGRPLPAVMGDRELATLIGLGPSRPRMLLASAPERGPWLNPERLEQSGGVVVWRASDTAGTPPDDIARTFPGLVPEVPRSFDRLVNGRAAPLRVGWAIVRPKVR
jgi:hypothetical protein